MDEPHSWSQSASVHGCRQFWALDRGGGDSKKVCKKEITSKIWAYTYLHKTERFWKLYAVWLLCCDGIMTPKPSVGWVCVQAVPHHVRMPNGSIKECVVHRIWTVCFRIFVVMQVRHDHPCTWGSTWDSVHLLNSRFPPWQCLLLLWFHGNETTQRRWESKSAKPKAFWTGKTGMARRFVSKMRMATTMFSNHSPNDFVIAMVKLVCWTSLL